MKVVSELLFSCLEGNGLLVDTAIAEAEKCT